MRLIARGAIAGLAGTTVMSAALLMAKKAGMVPGKVQPKEIVENLEEKLGVREYLPKSAFQASWVILHFGYGTIAGVVYALIQNKLLDIERSGLVGSLFGILLWVLGYCGWLPLLGLYPPPNRVPKRKVGANALIHVTYGTATTVAYRRLHSWRG